MTDDLDLDAGRWAIPSEDMKRTKAQKINGQAHIVPLPRQAVAILRELQPLTGAREYVFPGFRDPTAPMSEAGISAALAAMGYKGRHSWHGYRASGRTMLRVNNVARNTVRTTATSIRVSARVKARS